MELQLKFSSALSALVPTNGSKVLVAVSGGVDSMVLLHLMHQSNLDPIVAHCNFKLRGKESDLDAEFVRQSAENMGLTYHEKSFNTSEFASDNGISTQMAARKLRYEWFEKLADQEGCEFIAVAHHADDSIETVILNLVKGTGIAGMHGIKPKFGKIIRPLINMRRAEIIAYANHRRIVWREDSSNSETHYERNFVRHEVMPMLRSLNPNTGEAIANHAILMQRYEHILEWITHSVEAKISRNPHQGRFTIFNLDLLLEYPEPATLLYHILRKHGFNYGTCELAISAETESGAQFISGNWALVRDRSTVVFTETQTLHSEEFFEIHEKDSAVDVEFGCLLLSFHEQVDETDFGKSNVAYLDASNITFPLWVRPVQAGDRFHPLGMQSSKLASDFFTDTKASLVARTSSYAIGSNDKILWLAPHRIDDRFKILPNTQKVLRLEWQSTA